MAKKKKIIQMLADNNISFDFIENEKGKKAYEEEVLDINADNADDYAKTGNFSGVRIYNFTPDEIPNFDKVSSDAEAWAYILPIVEITLSALTEKQLYALLGIVGKELKFLSLNYSKLSKLELDKIVKACPKLCKIELSDDNWERDNRLPVELHKIGKQKFESIICRNFAVDNEVDWSILNIESLELDECDTSKITFPDNLKVLNCTATNEMVTIKGAKNLYELTISVNNESAKNIDLKEINKLSILDLNIEGANGVKVNLPTSLLSLNFSGAFSKAFSLSFLSPLNSLESLSIRSKDQGFKNYDAISGLSNLKVFKLDENGVGNEKFKSDFKPDFLKGLKKLEELNLRYVVNLSDFSFVKDLPVLKTLEVNTSRVKTLKGLEFGKIEKLIMHDCHSISDWTPILKTKISDLKFFISSYWGTKVEMSPNSLNQLAESNIKTAEISLDKIKLLKKDLKLLEKTFTLDGDTYNLSLDRK